jgi:carboxylate-amine ligase
MEGELVDTSGAGSVPAEAMLRRLLGQLRPQLERAGDWELTRTLAEQAVGRGTAASQQRHAFARRRLLTDVADLVLGQTRDIPPTAGMLGLAPPGTGPEQIAPAVLGRYRPSGYDEVVDGTGAVRPYYRAMMRTLERLGPQVLDERAAARTSEQGASGVKFRISGEAESRPFPFDLVPRIIEAADWARLREGLAQRVRALEAFLRDTYSERSAVADGIVPDWVVRDSPGLRHTGRAVPVDAVRASVSGIDVVCGGEGRWQVLEDNLRVPSGVGYAIENRRLTESALPELSPPVGIAGLDGVPALLHEALVAVAPQRVRGEPSVAVVTTGEDDSAYFEHAFLAEEMGVPLTEPSGLVVIDDVLHLVADGSQEAGPRPRRVDVLYRRIDEDELLAAPGADGAPLGPSLLRALRAGTLSFANAPGNGVGDDKVVYAYVPRMISYYLGEQPLLDDVPTYVCGDPEQLDHVLGNLADLVVKPVDGYGGAGVLIGPRAEPHELTSVRGLLLADPRRWVAQEPVALSTHPTWREGRLEPCAVDLRAFVYQASEVVVAPASLSRFAPPGSLIVNSSRGGGSKDTWLLRS